MKYSTKALLTAMYTATAACGGEVKTAEMDGFNQADGGDVDVTTEIDAGNIEVGVDVKNDMVVDDVVNDVSNACNLVQNLSVSENPYDPMKGTEYIQFSLAEDGVVSVMVESSGVLVNQIINEVWLEKGVYAVDWDGRYPSGEQVSNGQYWAYVALEAKSCDDVEKVAFEVKKDITDCVLKVEAYNDTFTVIAGEIDVEMGCFKFETVNCSVDLKRLTFTNNGVGDAHNNLTNNRLMFVSWGEQVSEIANFETSDTISFTDLSLLNAFLNKMPVTLCMKSDISEFASGQGFAVDIDSASDIEAYVEGETEKVKVEGNLPLMGNYVIVGE